MKKKHTVVFSYQIAKDLKRIGITPVKVEECKTKKGKNVWVYETTPELERAIEKAKKYLGIKECIYR